MLASSVLIRRHSAVLCTIPSTAFRRPTGNSCLYQKLHGPGYKVFTRSIHQSVNTGEVILKGCERLPDLTLLWPFHLWPSDIAATVLDQIQQHSDMPWWCTILVGGAILKLPVFGFNIFNLRKIQHFFVTSPRQLTHFVLTYFNNLVTKGEAYALRIANHERRFTILREGVTMEYNFKPSMFSHISYVPLYWLAGMHMSMFAGLHWLNRIQYMPLTTGGLTWCPDLTSTDPYMVLPAVCLISGLLNLYLHPMHRLFPLPEFKLNHILPLAPILAVSFSLLASLPADFLLYMISANATACLMNTLVLRFPRVYSELGLLSSGETFNRIIPPAFVFKELNKTFDRQLLLLEQRKEQLALLKVECQPLIEGEKSQKLLSDESEVVEKSESSDVSKDVSDVEIPTITETINVRFVKKGTASDSDHSDLPPHLNVKKIFTE